MRQILTALVASLCFVLPAQAEIRTVCTLITDETGQVIVQEGVCETRQSPASTFKVAISLMGFDAGILTNPHDPEWPFKEGYADWREEWREATDPARWMQLSVVWYSQEITRKLGLARVAQYLADFDYGNKDMSGHKGGEGLTHAWLGSSLQISPVEQVAFMRRLARGELPVSDSAAAHTATIMDHGVQPGGWRVYGKTGAGAPRDAEGQMIFGQPFGWFVGWAEKEGRRVMFARLVQADSKPDVPPGFTARDALLAEYFGENSSLE